MLYFDLQQVLRNLVHDPIEYIEVNHSLLMIDQILNINLYYFV
jgi:hypothetical protein